MSFLYVLFLFVLCYCSSNQAQQHYLGNAVSTCTYTNNSALGYSCNGVNRTCLAYLIFRSKPPYNNVSSISDLLGCDNSQLSGINSVSADATFKTDSLVIAPVTCSCSGQYYQKNNTYVVQRNDTPTSIAYDIYQGLSTCQAIGDQNRNVVYGVRLNIPLRCACPTNNQAVSGINYLLSYPVIKDDFPSTISARFSRFGADTETTAEANEMSLEDPIFPLTTLLVPLQDPPNSSQTGPPSDSSPPSSPSTPPEPGKSSNKIWIYFVAIIGGILLLVLVTLIFVALSSRRNKNMFRRRIKNMFRRSIKNNPDVPNSEDEGPQTQPFTTYEFDEIQEATNNFSPSCLEGSFYRGNFNGNLAAVKEMNEDVTEGIRLFDGLNHANLIRLLGACLHDRIYYLVFEYAASGPLSGRNYYASDGEMFLDWLQRVQISWNVAKGINYLHSLDEPRAHRNINSSNVFLDSDLQAKIGDLPMTRSEKGDQETLLKKDIHDFGLLMLEIIAGNKFAGLRTQENSDFLDILRNAVAEDVGGDQLNRIIDNSMEGRYPPQQAKNMVSLIYDCLNDSPAARPPSMGELERGLSRIFSGSNISAYQSSSLSIS